MSEDKQLKIVYAINAIILILRDIPPYHHESTPKALNNLVHICTLFTNGYGFLHNLPKELSTPLEKALKIEGDRIYPKEHTCNNLKTVIG